MRAFLFWLCTIGVLAGSMSLMVGCHGVHPTPGVTTPHQGVTSTPISLTGVAKSTEVIAVLAMVGVGVGVGLYFFLPAAHQLSLTIAGVAGGVEIAALVTRVSLWFVPWVAGALALSACAFFIYEVYRNRKAIEALLPTGLLPSEVKLVHG